MKSYSIQTSKTDFLEQFREAESSFIPQLKQLKSEAISNLASIGFPSTKNEDWKYTNVAPLLANTFNRSEEKFNLTRNDIKYFLPEDSNACLMVFENGRLNLELSSLGLLPNGIIAGNIRDHYSHPSVKMHLGKIAMHANESFVALNTALFQEGAFIFAEKNVALEKPIHLLFVNDARFAPTVCYPRNFIIASPGSRLSVSESYYSIDTTHASFCNPVTEIFVDDNAQLEYCKNEAGNANDYHIDYTGAMLRRDSRLYCHTITSGGKMVRNNLRIELQQPNGSAYLNGLYITSGETHVDNHSFIDHASPDCYSNELYKGVLSGRSHGVFNGKIFVRSDAQKTNAFQSNKNILLSDEASVNAKPQLEIYADDVKCSHGATTGQLDPLAMFYLRSRGIGENNARIMLTNAFAEEILDRITIESTREKLKDLIHSRFMKGNE